jgi:hypothetical protein
MQTLENNLVFDTLNAMFTIERAYFCSKPYAHSNSKFIELTKLFFNVCVIGLRKEEYYAKGCRYICRWF